MGVEIMYVACVALDSVGGGRGIGNEAVRGGQTWTKVEMRRRGILGSSGWHWYSLGPSLSTGSKIMGPLMGL